MALEFKLNDQPPEKNVEEINNSNEPTTQKHNFTIIKLAFSITKV
jgi:hypothetical protein